MEEQGLFIGVSGLHQRRWHYHILSWHLPHQSPCLTTGARLASVRRERLSESSPEASPKDRRRGGRSQRPPEVLQPAHSPTCRPAQTTAGAGPLLAPPASPPELNSQTRRQKGPTEVARHHPLPTPAPFPQSSFFNKAPNDQTIHLSSLRLAFGENSQIPRKYASIKNRIPLALFLSVPELRFTRITQGPIRQKIIFLK